MSILPYLHNIYVWLTVTAWQDAMSWFGTNQQKFASLLYLSFKRSDEIVKSGALDDIWRLVPEVAVDIKNKDYAELYEDVKALVKPILEVHDIILDKPTRATIINSVIQQANDAAIKAEGQAAATGSN
jgi:hypothetical protein